MSRISPCIWFTGRAEEAARFYCGLFPDSAILDVSHYAEGMHLPAGTVLLVEFSLAGQTFQALNGNAALVPTPSLSFVVDLDEASEARRLYDGLAEGGQVLMPLDAYPWSPCFGWVQDRFGVSWQLLVGPRAPDAPLIVPALMFSDAQAGRAAEAIAAYTGTFPDSGVAHVERYVAGEGPEGTIKQARFTLAGQTFAAMDSPVDHGFAFTEGLSLSVRCEDQAEVDRLWAALTAGGEPGPCGWLKDRFGVSWQVVPEALVTLQRRGDADANARMFQAMFPMGRLDVATLERAWAGA